MSQFLFFHPDLSSKNIILPEEESKHLIRVLRKQKGDIIQLMDGKGNLAFARIEEDHQKKCLLLITEISLKVKNRNYHFDLVIAPTKNMERIEWMLEKCCEIGLDAIYFINCENSERSKLNLERLEKICISAIKQSKQFYLPEIHPLVDFKSFIEKAKSTDSTKLIAWCETDMTENIQSKLRKKANNHLIFMVGPEGDFSENEISLAKANGFSEVSLGSNILRTETAGLYACVTASQLL
jgi:16S rRNA (uracil1498-N3)-methyltransferase